jgi:arylamine N-acetyltransferase
MIDQSTDPRLFKRYLRLLGISPKKPDRDALFKLTTAQLTQIPFENISKLYYLKKEGLRGLPDFERHLHGIENYHFGGTCYANNYYLHLLLKYLGYEVFLCGADMADPDVHIVNIVRVEGHEYVVDGGYGAPFLEPMPRDLNIDYELAWGNYRYVLKPRDADGYTINPNPRSIQHFEKPIADSFREQATFMNAVLLVRYYPNRSITIHNLSLTESKGLETRTTKLGGRDKLPGKIEQYFGIPTAVAAEAVGELERFNDAWS